MDERRRRPLDPGRRRRPSRPRTSTSSGTPRNLERLARTYWWYLSRVTLGLIRVNYTETERAGRAADRARSCCCASTRPSTSCRAQPRHRALADQRRPARLPARARRRRLPRDRRPPLPDRRRGLATVHVEVEVANFYPAIAPADRALVYSHTQSRIHVIVTHGFLRSLARLELEESAVGRFAEEQRGVRRARTARSRRLDAVGLDRGDRGRRRSRRRARDLAAAALAAGVPVSARSLARSCARRGCGARCPSASA